MSVIPPSFEGSGNYVLKVRGDSMLADHVLDGDFVIVRRTNKAVIGDYIVTLMSGSPSLQRFTGEQSVECVVVGLMRQFSAIGAGR